MKRKLLSLLVLLMAVTGARAGYGWYDCSMTIGGVSTNPSTWSGNPDSPTDLGYVSNLTVTSVAFKIWSDANDRGGANIYFRIYDENGQQGSDQDLHLGTATFIPGSTHDYSISWTGSEDLASAVSLTLVQGKDYYVDIWVKTYGISGDEWYSNGGANYHAKMNYTTYPITFATGNDNTDWTINPTAAAQDTKVTISYSGDHKVKSVGFLYDDDKDDEDEYHAAVSASDNSYSFTMPAENVEVTTELWYCLDEEADNSDLADKRTVYLKRTLLPNGWNTFCAPFAIANPASVFGEGVKVKELTDAEIEGGTLTLTFGNPASGIEACKPYLIKLSGESSVNLAADGKEFTLASSQNYNPSPKTISGIVTFQPVLVPTPLTNGDKDVLFVTGGDKLTYPNKTGNINAFRAYFLLNPAGPGGGGVREYRMCFEDEETGIRSIENGQLIIDNENDAWYDLSGRKMVNGKLPKGIYIHNGRKEVMK